MSSDPDEPEGCERAGQLGDFVVRFEQTGGDCGEPADERATLLDLDQLGPCERIEPDVWSADDCTRWQNIRCDGTEFTTELTLRPDGSLTGTQTRVVAGQCSGTYDVSAERQ